MNAQENFYEVSRKKFENFFNSLSKEDNVGIFVHANCLDGMASAIFVNAILEEKGIKPKAIEFFEHGTPLVRNFMEIKERNNLDKIIIADIGIDEIFLKDFEKFVENNEVIFVDHHLSSLEIKESERVVKAGGTDCAAWIIYELGKNLFDAGKWEWLLYPAMIHEFAYNKKEHLDFIKRKFPEIKEETIGNSEPGLLMKKLGYVINFHKGNQIKAFEMIKTKDFDTIDRTQSEVSKEFNYWVEKFKNEKEVYPEADLYICHLKPKYDLGTSGITTTASLTQREKIWMGVSDFRDEKLRVSVRNNGAVYDVNEIIKESVRSLKDATGGGHKEAAGATILREDYEKFKKNFIELVIKEKKLKESEQTQSSKEPE